MSDQTKTNGPHYVIRIIVEYELFVVVEDEFRNLGQPFEKFGTFLVVFVAGILECVIKFSFIVWSVELNSV